MLYGRFFLFLLIVTVGASAADAPEAVEPNISVKQTTPVTVAFLEHEGPYWRVGPLFRRVLDYVAKQDQPVTIVVRYLSHPSQVEPRSLQAQVGFVLSGINFPGAPYQQARWPAETVASLTVDRSFVLPQRYYALLDDWSRRHGYLPIGPVTEIYSYVPADSTGIAGSPFEIRMSIHEPETVANRPSVVAVETTQEAGSDKAQGEDVTDGQHGAAKRNNREGWARRGKRGVAPPTRRDRSAWDPTGIQKGDRAPTTAKNATTTTSSVDANRSKPQPLPSDNPGSSNDPEPIGNLLSSHRYAELAERLIPIRLTFVADRRIWLGQIIIRLKALGRGLDRVDHHRAEEVMALTLALSDRFGEVFHTQTLLPIDQAVVRRGSGTDSRAKATRATLRDLDQLLSSFASGIETPESVIESLVVIFGRIEAQTRGPRSRP